MYPLSTHTPTILNVYLHKTCNVWLVKIMCMQCDFCKFFQLYVYPNPVITVDKENNHEYAAFGITLCVSIIAMSIIVAVDAMFFTVVEHACALFEMVGINITKVNLSIDWSDNDDYKKICYCVDLHKEALRFTELIESNYSMAFTPIIGLSLLAMSVSGVQVVLNMDSLKDVVRFGVFVVCQMFHIFFNSIYGQKIYDYSLGIHDSVYGSDWLDFSIKTKKLLTVILMRSQKPCLLTAGKLYILSMASFSSVMQTACSYFTVLTSML